MDKATVLNRVYAANLPSRAKTIMFYLVNRANKELTCFPAIPRISKETGMSERTVQRALKELCAEGYIEKSPRYRENGGQSSNLYILLAKEEQKLREEQKQEDVVLKAGTLDVKALKTEGKLNEKSSCMQVMQIIDFSLYGEVSMLLDCHRDGDTFRPP